MPINSLHGLPEEEQTILLAWLATRPSEASMLRQTPEPFQELVRQTQPLATLLGSSGLATEIIEAAILVALGLSDIEFNQAVISGSDNPDFCKIGFAMGQPAQQRFFTAMQSQFGDAAVIRGHEVEDKDGHYVLPHQVRYTALLHPAFLEKIRSAIKTLAPQEKYQIATDNPSNRLKMIAIVQQRQDWYSDDDVHSLTVAKLNLSGIQFQALCSYLLTTTHPQQGRALLPPVNLDNPYFYLDASTQQAPEQEDHRRDLFDELREQGGIPVGSQLQIIFPLNTGGHWVTIAIDIHHNQMGSYTFSSVRHNPLCQSVHDQNFIDTIQRQLINKLHASSISLMQVLSNPNQQPRQTRDLVTCGPLAVEANYLLLQGQPIPQESYSHAQLHEIYAVHWSLRSSIEIPEIYQEPHSPLPGVQETAGQRLMGAGGASSAPTLQLSDRSLALITALLGGRPG